MIQGYDGLDALPSALRIYGASDYATMAPEKGKKEPDFTEHGVVGVDTIGDLWFIDWFFDQCETDEGIRQWIRLVNLYRPMKWWNEGGTIDKAIAPAIRDAMRRNGRFVTIEALPSLDDKAVKLIAFHARCAARTVHFPIRRKWAEHVIDQLIKFPGAKHDDAADVCGLIGRGVDQMLDASVPVAQPRPQLIPFTEKWLEYNQFSTPKVRYF